MSITDRLDQIEARANAATKGPWSIVSEDGVILALVLTDEDDGLFYGDSGYDAPITTETGEDAEFIAHARTDVPALVAALRAVLDLHRPVRVYAYVEDCGCGNEDHVIIENEWGDDLCFDTPTGDVQCAYCRAEQSYVEHPCATVRAIEEALR